LTVSRGIRKALDGGSPTEKELDGLFFRAVFLRWGGKCIRCGAEPKVIVDRKGVIREQNLTPHHFFCRSYPGTKWEPDNGFLLCYPCHIKWAQVRHEEFRDFIIERIGNDSFQKLKYQAYNGTRPDLFAMKFYLTRKIELYESTISSAAIEVPKSAMILRNGRKVSRDTMQPLP